MGRRGESGGGREATVDDRDGEDGMLTRHFRVHYERTASKNTYRLVLENGLSIGGDLGLLALAGFALELALALAMERLMAADAAVAFAPTSAADFFTPSDAVVKEAPGDFEGGVLGAVLTHVWSEGHLWEGQNCMRHCYNELD